MLEKTYDSKKYEEKIYQAWEKSGYFAPEAHRPRAGNPNSDKAFSIVLPPPNVTGNLHTGHAMMLAIEDLMIRYNRMLGKKTLWIPGTDHAAIATQSKVEGKIYKEENKTRHDLGREEFLSRVEDYAQKSHDTIINQLKKMGSSLDWSREAFTLDKKRQKAVYTAFKQMYDDGLIYRGHRIVNWDPKGGTTVSDDEVEHEEKRGILYTFKYSKDFPIPIATTRPETKVGDTAVAVNPEDSRYKKYIGKTFNVKFVGVDLVIKIVGDEEVDPEYGTGALGVTPAHSAVDWEIAKRHNLEMKQVIDEKGQMINSSDELNGKTIYKARKIIVERLEKDGLLEKEEKINNTVAKSYRTGGIIEPLPKLQWFVSVNSKFKVQGSKLEGIKSGAEITLKEIMRKVVETGQIKIVPKRFEKIYFHWIDNLRDWNISRQIWYGHRIPAWHKDKEIYVDIKPPKEDGWEQDPDTLDTWFSSGLWTFSTLGWPDKTEDFKTFHPTDVLETGYDILFFWVARMILMSTYLLGDIPFKTVYLHGMVRDEKGRKMSKSLDNTVDPLDLIDKFGADALRMAFIVGNAPGGDLNLSDDKVKAYKYFANKIWNASRFILMNLEDFDPNDANVEDEKLNSFVKEITEEIENYHFHLASEKLYHYFWHTLADVIIEETKDKIKNGSTKEKLEAQSLLYHHLKTLLILLHPFMPFVTEAVWQSMPKAKDDPELLIIASWPGTKFRN